MMLKLHRIYTFSLLLSLIVLLFTPNAMAVTRQQAMEAIANVRETPYLGLPYDDFRTCFGKEGGNLLNEMFDESYPYYDQAQAAFENLSLSRMIETIPRAQLVDYMTAREKEWAEYKRAYGYISFLAGPNLGGLADMFRDGFFNATKQYLNNYSMSELYREYTSARNRGRDRYGAWQSVENATFNSRSMAAGWHNAIGRMQDLCDKFDINMPGEKFLESTFNFSYRRGDYSVDLDSMVESFIRGQAQDAKKSAIKALKDDPNLKRCLRGIKTGNSFGKVKSDLSGGSQMNAPAGVSYAKVLKTGKNSSNPRMFVLERVVFSKFPESSDLCKSNNNCKHYRRSASGELLEDYYAISEGKASYTFKQIKESSGKVLSDYAVNFEFNAPPRQIYAGDELEFKAGGSVRGYTTGWYLNRSFTYYLKTNGSNSYFKRSMVNFFNRDSQDNSGLYRGGPPKTAATVITIPSHSKNEVVLGGKLGWDPGLYIDWIYKEVTGSR